MKLKTERDLSYIDPLTVEFFQNNGKSSISVILLTNRRKDGPKERRTDGQTNGHKFNTSLAEVMMQRINWLDQKLDHKKCRDFFILFS